MRSKTTPSLARTLRRHALVAGAVGVSAALAPLPPGFAGATGTGTLQVTGAVHEVIELTKADCSAYIRDSPSNGTLDTFDVAEPSTASSDPAFVLTASTPNPKSVYYTSTYTEVDLAVGSLTAPLKVWGHAIGGLPSKIPAAELHFAANGRSGSLDLSLSPQSDAQGEVHVAVSWTGADCGQSPPKAFAT